MLGLWRALLGQLNDEQKLRWDECFADGSFAPAKKGVKAVGKVILGTVKGDLHDIGKNLVGMMIEGAGFEVVDLGTDVPPAKSAEVARSIGANIVGMSALLTTTMQSMRMTMEAVEDMGIRNRVEVTIGGAPVTEEFAKEFGPDGYAPDASRRFQLLDS